MAATLTFVALATLFCICTSATGSEPDSSLVGSARSASSDDFGLVDMMDKRVPHPSWRQNVRINHIQSGMSEFGNEGLNRFAGFFDHKPSRPLVYRYARQNRPSFYPQFEGADF